MIFNPPCATCIHFNREDQSKETCTAFPDGIPLPILEGETDHKQPYTGDNGIQYTPNAAAKRMAEDSVWESNPARRAD
jgi:hypothetical protein